MTNGTKRNLAFGIAAGALTLFGGLAAVGGAMAVVLALPKLAMAALGATGVGKIGLVTAIGGAVWGAGGYYALKKGLKMMAASKGSRGAHAMGAVLATTAIAAATLIAAQAVRSTRATPTAPQVFTPYTAR